MVAYNCQKDSILPEEEFNPVTGETRRVDAGFRRYWRGFKKQFILNSWDSVYFLGALTAAILGIYASIVGMKTEFALTPVTAFTCANPAA